MRQSASLPPSRGHNNPPELIEVDRPVTQTQLQEVVTAIAEIREESLAKLPNRERVVAQVSTFRRLAKLFAFGTGWTVAAAVTGIIGQEAGLAYTDNKQRIFEALVSASEAAVAWLHSLPAPF